MSSSRAWSRLWRISWILQWMFEQAANSEILTERWRFFERASRQASETYWNLLKHCELYETLLVNITCEHNCGTYEVLWRFIIMKLNEVRWQEYNRILRMSRGWRNECDCSPNPFEAREECKCLVDARLEQKISIIHWVGTWLIHCIHCDYSSNRWLLDYCCSMTATWLLDDF